MKKILIIYMIMVAISFSCDDRLEELNIPEKAALEVPGETLFTNGVREMFDMMVNTNVNENVFRLYAQYWAQTTYPDESQYNMVSRNNPDNIYLNAYREVLKDLSEARAIFEEIDLEDPLVDAATVRNKMAMIDICMAYTYATLVDIFGHIPYSEALDANNLNPAYDDQEEVYNNVLATLDDAIANLDVEAEGYEPDQDPVYEGDVAAWMKFANSLKARMAMRLADVDETRSRALLAEALASGIIESNEENVSITYYPSPPSTNPLYEDLVLSGRRDFIPANTIVNVMNELNDPRRDVYFTDPIDGEYVGGVYGSANAYNNYSHIGRLFFEPDLTGTLINNAEMKFLLAEAAERGYPVEMTAEEYYNLGIRSSFLQWNRAEEEYAAYIAQPSVAYSTAEGDWRQKIGIQMWLALYNQGFEGWSTWRRLDFEAFNVPAGLEFSDIPVRMIYPINEGQRNGANVRNAAERLGGDTPQSKVFWDVN